MYVSITWSSSLSSDGIQFNYNEQLDLSYKRNDDLPHHRRINLSALGHVSPIEMEGEIGDNLTNQVTDILLTACK